MRTLLIIAAFVIGIPLLAYLLWVVHCTLDRIIVRHARRFCSRRGLVISRVRWQPGFKLSDGRREVKTENTLVQLDCFDAEKQRRLILLSVWPFGVRKLVSDDIYPESYDTQWPQKCA